MTTLGAIFLLFLYFIPAVIAISKRKSNTGAIIALNLFLGWTFIGWIVALIWALANDNKPQTIIVNNNVSADKTINPVITQPIQEKIQFEPLQIENTAIKSHQEMINQLQQLKQLLDGGVLTREEFDEQKTQILAS